jgi:hypothetical protein
MRFTRIVFRLAGAWGLLVLVPLYFMLDVVGRQDPPAINHPEYYYGFLGVALAWQLAFFVIGADPARFRPMMLPAMVEKFGHVAAMTVLHLRGQLRLGQLMFQMPDLVWGVLFVSAYLATRPASADSSWA